MKTQINPNVFSKDECDTLQVHLNILLVIIYCNQKEYTSDKLKQISNYQADNPFYTEMNDLYKIKMIHEKLNHCQCN